MCARCVCIRACMMCVYTCVHVYISDGIGSGNVWGRVGSGRVGSCPVSLTR